MAKGLGAQRGVTTIVNTAFPRAGLGGLPKMLVVPLCEDETLLSGGSTAFVSRLYDLPEVRSLGPIIKAIRVHWVAEGATANFQGKVTMAWSVLGRTWSNPVDLITAQAGSQAGVIGAWYTNDSAFGLQLRFAVEAASAAGSAVDSARSPRSSRSSSRADVRYAPYLSGLKGGSFQSFVLPDGDFEDGDQELNSGTTVECTDAQGRRDFCEPLGCNECG